MYLAMDSCANLRDFHPDRTMRPRGMGVLDHVVQSLGQRDLDRAAQIIRNAATHKMAAHLTQAVPNSSVHAVQRERKCCVVITLGHG